jgi:hypothetical protein
MLTEEQWRIAGCTAAYVSYHRYGTWVPQDTRLVNISTRMRPGYVVEMVFAYRLMTGPNNHHNAPWHQHIVKAGVYDSRGQAQAVVDKLNLLLSLEK